jgi:hypothetical protein
MYRANFGIDALKLWVSYEGDPTMPDSDRHIYRGGSERHVAEVMLDNGYVVQVSFDQRKQMSMDLNPSRVLDPDDWGLLTPDALPNLMAVVEEAVQSDLGIQIVGELADARVTRLDVARDFEVRQPSRFIVALAPYKRAHVRQDHHLWFDGKRDRWTALYIGGKKTSFVRLYIKDRALSPSSADDSEILRFEVQARRHWLDTHGMRTLRDITYESAWSLLEDRWTWAKLGRDVVHPSLLVDRLKREAGLDPVRQLAFLGWVVQQQNGHASELPDGWEREFTEILDRVGVPDRVLPEDRWQTKSSRNVSSARLSLETGGEVGTTFVRRRTPRRRRR